MDYMRGIRFERHRTMTGMARHGIVGAKDSLSLLSRCSEEVRLPLVGPTESVMGRIRDAMDHAGALGQPD